MKHDDRAALQPVSDGLRFRLGPVLVYSLLFLLAARLFRLAFRYAVNIFFWDQWVFHDADLFQQHSFWEMFRWQFGPHRLGLGPLLSRIVEPPFAWDSRVQSFVACGVVTIAALCALWLKKRLFGRITVWDAVIPIFYLSATQYESLFITSNFAHGSLPLLLITVYCLGWTITNLAVRYVFVLMLNFVTIYTGFGVFLGLLTPILLVFDYRSNLRSKPAGTLYLALGLLISCASMGSFFYGYTFQPAVDCFTAIPRKPQLFLTYVMLMYANFWTSRTKALAIVVGMTVVLWLIWALVSAGFTMPKYAGLGWAQKAIPATLVAFSLMFAFNTAYGRACLGLASGHSSRYTNYLALGVVGAYMWLLTLQSPKLRCTLLTLAVLLSLATLPIRREDRGTISFFRDIKQNWKSCYLRGGTIPECNAVAGFRISQEPDEVLQAKLQFLRQHHLNLYSGR